MPANSVALSINDSGVCSACEYHNVYQSLTPEGKCGSRVND